MPFFLIPTSLGVSFFLIWAFIAGMIFREGQLAAQRERDSDVTILPLIPHRMATRSSVARSNVKRASRKRLARAAS